MWIDGVGRRRLQGHVGRGGQADVYRIGEAGGVELVVKLFHKAQGQLERKLGRMLASRPEDPGRAREHRALAWPTHMVRDSSKGTFVGYAMPFVSRMKPLHTVLVPSTRMRELPEFTLKHLIRTGRNLAAAVAACHKTGYVVGDLNETNILVASNALITMVDTDSFQVPAGDSDGSRVYVCPVGRPEYTPPELQGRDFSRFTRTEVHDRFGLAVLLFQLLQDGRFPYDVRGGPGIPDNPAERLKRGLFPHALDGDPRCLPPVGVRPFEALHPALIALLRRAFEDGHSRPSCRPTARDWSRALHEAERALEKCSTSGPGHWFWRSAAHASCTECVMQRKLMATRARAAQQSRVRTATRTQSASPWQPHRATFAGSLVSTSPRAHQAQVTRARPAAVTPSAPAPPPPKRQSAPAPVPPWFSGLPQPSGFAPWGPTKQRVPILRALDSIVDAQRSELRVSLVERAGARCLDLRLAIQNRSGACVPTVHGLTIPVSLVPSLIRMCDPKISERRIRIRDGEFLVARKEMVGTSEYMDLRIHRGGVPTDNGCRLWTDFLIPLGVSLGRKRDTLLLD